MTAPKKKSAVQKLELSRLAPKSVQSELMGDDLDLASLLVYLKSTIKFDSIESVRDITVTRTVEGASTVVVDLIDPHREILRSGLLNSRLDIQLDGLWFRLVKVEKQDDDLILTFEDREIAVLRTYKNKKIAHRSQVTRAEFVNNLIREVKEFRIPVIIPELHKVQPIQKVTDLSLNFGQDSAVADKSGGIPESAANAADNHHHREGTAGTALRPTLTVQGDPADKDQVRNANIILDVGSSMGCNRKVMVSAIMTAIQESWIRNLPYGDRDSLGLFQQRDSWGSRQDRLDPATAARMYYDHAIKEDRLDPTRPYYDLCQAVQHSHNGLLYQRWYDEANAFVTAYGIPGGDRESSASDANNMSAFSVAGSDFIFYRGDPVNGGKSWKPEDSWTCIQRLAGDVNWRAFFVSGTFYFLPEDDLFKSKPAATIQEFSEGVEGLDGDYDTGKIAASCTLTARVGTWLVPPGAVIVLQEMGPWNGRWIVNTFDRSMFDSKATITLKRPLPRLPEPAQNDINTLTPNPTWADPTSDPANVPVFGGLLPPELRGTREGIVSIAEKALAVEKTNHYHYPGDEGGAGGPARPIPDSLFSADAHNAVDCSSFVTLVYKEASVDDPNGNGYDGNGFTGTLWQHGTPVVAPNLGDLVFYRGNASIGSRSIPGHVGVFVGGSMVIEIGSESGVRKLPMNYRSDIMGYRSYLLLS